MPGWPGNSILALSLVIMFGVRKESIALRILPEELGCWGDSLVAKRDFASKEEAEEAARRLAGWGLNMIVYRYCDPVTGVKKWFIRRAPRRREGKRAKSER